MRAALAITALAGVVLAASTVAAPTIAVAQTYSCAREPGRLCRHATAPARHRHIARLRRAHVSRAYHIPRFDQGEAEAFVHTVYPYRTGLYAPWPDAYGTPYPY